MIGKRLAHYTILAKLGEGGMGVVYRAEDGLLKRQVALKVLPQEFSGQQSRLVRFQREAQTLAALNHPNIVTIYSVEEADDVPFLTMELVEGERLSEMIRRGGLPLHDIFRVAIPLADALSKAHETGVIHRDVKPSNIMIDRDGRTKVLDFGIAKLGLEEPPPEGATDASTATLTGRSLLVGTLPYMSPEQLDGGTADARSDLFSLGVVLFEMATGERPFKGSSSGALITGIMRDVPPDVDAVRTDIPHHLGRIIRRCLEKDPDLRYQAAKDVRNDLIDLRREIDSSTSGSRPRSAPPRRLSTHRSRAAVGAAAVLLAITGGFAAWRFLHPDERPSPPPITDTEPAAQEMVVALPFENLGPPDDEYFAVGVTDEISSRLASVEGLGVISRTSAMQYKDNRPPLPEIAAQLGVEFVLEGSVWWQHEPVGQDRVRIILQLVRTADDTRVWSGRYVRVLDDIFAVQGEIAEEVIRELELAIAEPARRAMSEPMTDNLEAYNLYLRAMEYRRAADYSLPGLELAAQLLGRAVELDPDFARAWAELAWVHSMIYFNDDSTEHRRTLAADALERADQLAPDAPAVRTAAGYYYYRVDEDFSRALTEFDIALQGQPGNVDVLMGIGFVRRRLGDWQGSLESLKRALELDPRSGGISDAVGETYAALREYDPAATYFARAVTLAPDQPRFWTNRTTNELNRTGDLSAARDVLDEAPNPGDPFLLLHQVVLDLYDGRYDAALGRLSAADVDRLGDLDRAEAYLSTALACELLGREQEARRRAEHCRADLEQRLEQPLEAQYLRSRLALAYTFLGRDQDAIELGRAAAEAETGDAFSAPGFLEELAKVYARTGRPDQALELLEQLMTTPYHHALGPTELLLDPIWAPLRSEPGFRELSRSLN